MDKMQVLYPKGQLAELRRVARQLDRPISEIVREATAEWLRRHAPPTDTVREAPPVYHAGAVTVDAAHLREASYSDEQH